MTKIKSELLIAHESNEWYEIIFWMHEELMTGLVLLQTGRSQIWDDQESGEICPQGWQVARSAEQVRSIIFIILTSFFFKAQSFSLKGQIPFLEDGEEGDFEIHVPYMLEGETTLDSVDSSLRESREICLQTA